MTQKKKKRSWIKLILKVIGGVLLLLVIMLTAVYYYLGTIVKEAVTRFIPPITGTTAAVEDVDLSLLSGRVGIRGLTIGNPTGFSDRNIFELGSIQIVFQPRSVFSDRIIIDSVAVSGTKVSAELKNLYSLDSNVQALQNNINQYLGTGKAKTTSAKPQQAQAVQPAQGTSAPAKQVVIRDLNITGTELAVGVGGRTVTLPVPTIHQKNIGEGSKKKSIPEMIADILDTLSLESLKALAASAKDLAKQGLSGAKDLVKGGTDQVRGAADTVSRGAKDAINSLKGLF